MKSKTPCIVAVILVVGLLLRIFAFVGVLGSDDLVYAKHAYSIANGTFHIGADYHAFASLRTGLLLPVALLVKVFGPGEWALVAYPFLLSMCGIVLAFIAGRLFFNEFAGLLAAAVMAVLPMDVRMASQLLTDVPAAFLYNAALLSAYVGAQRETPLRKVAWAVLAGAAFGASWLTRESAVYVVPVIGGFLLWAVWRDRRNVALMLGFALTVAAIVAIESMVYWRATGDLLFRFHAMSRVAQEFSAYDTKDLNNVAVRLSHRIWVSGPKAIFITPYFAFLPLIALGAVGYFFWTRQKGAGFPSFWFLASAVLFNFASTSIHRYSPLLVLPRYLYTIIFPAAVLAGGWLAALLAGSQPAQLPAARARQFAGIALGALFLLTSARYYRGMLKIGPGSQTERAVCRLVSPSDPLYTDSRTRSVLEFFWRYKPATNGHDFAAMRAAEIPSGSFVLINRERIEFLKRFHSYEPPQFYTQVPAAWGQKWHSDGAGLYVAP